MKMILTLTKNEYIKLFRKKSVPILLILLMLLVFGISLIRPSRNYNTEYYNNGNYYSNESFSDQKNIFKQSIMSESTLENYTENEKAHYIVLNEFYRKQMELCDKAIELNLEFDDWRYRVFSEILNNDPYFYFYEYITNGGQYAEQIKEYMGYGYKNNFPITRANKYAGYLLAIEKNEYSESVRGSYEEAKIQLKDYENKLEEAKSEKISGTDKKDIDHEIFKLTGIVECYKSFEKTYNYMLDKKYEYQSDQHKTVNSTANELNNAINAYAGFKSEEEYNKPKNNSSETSDTYNKGYEYYDGDGYNPNQTYKEYSEKQLKNIENYTNKGKIGLYSLENDVTELSITRLSRMKSLSFVNLFWFIAPLAIFLASGMVSKEFSTKTINLLLIRPIKRWKILLSKYLCLVSLITGIIAVTLGVYMLGSGLRLGFADFSQPFLYISGGTAHSVNFILWLIGKVLISALPILCLISMTFMFSSVTKGNAVSLILGVLTLFSSVLILFFTNLFKNTDVLTYMPFPYFSMWAYTFDDLIVLGGNNFSTFGEIFKVNLTYGMIVLLSLTVLSIITVFIEFNKKDIK